MFKLLTDCSAGEDEFVGSKLEFLRTVSGGGFPEEDGL